MNLPFFNKQAKAGKTFFGLFLKEQVGIGLVLKLEKNNVILLDQEKFSYLNGWEHLTEAVDEVILKLEQRTKVRLHETIFFVYSHFIDEKTKEIKKAYLDKIKELVKNLKLKALGYIESYEAVINYLEKKEEQPLTAVLIELDHSNLSVFIYKRGELTYQKVLAHTDSLIDDLLMCFMEIKGKFMLPSRIILYNSKDLDNESTEIVTYRWSEALFVQLPRVEIVKEFEVIQGMLGVFAAQYGQKITETVFTEHQPREEVLGFVIGGDVAEGKVAQVEKEKAPISQAIPKSPFSYMPIMLDKFSNYLRTFSKVLTKKWTAIIGVVLILIGLFLNEYFLHKASLTLFLPSKTVKKDIELSSDNLTFETIAKTIDLKDSKATTGTKEVGEKARGSVTVHNFDDVEKTLAKGTVMETGGLKFSLDQEVKVASASVVTINGGIVKQTGKAKLTATADQIGPQSNVANGKQFKIADFSNWLFFGVNESPFTGGTKKEVKTTAKKDLDDLRKNIQNLAKKQKLDFPQRKNSDDKILNQLTEIEITDENFDKEVGEEADKLNLEAKVKITVSLYKDNEIKDKVLKILAGESDKGFGLKKDKLSYTIIKAEKKSNKIFLTVGDNGKVIKEISTQAVLKEVKVKNRDKIETLLKDKFKVQGFKLDIEPKLPLMQNLMPFFEKNRS